MNTLVLDNIDEVTENAIKWIRHLLIKNYHLTAKDADFAIDKSAVKNIYSCDIEMSSHDSIEEWAKEVYNFWKNYNK